MASKILVLKVLPLRPLVFGSQGCPRKNVLSFCNKLFLYRCNRELLYFVTIILCNSVLRLIGFLFIFINKSSSKRLLKLIFKRALYMTEERSKGRKVCYYYDGDVGNYYYGQGKC